MATATFNFEQGGQAMQCVFDFSRDAITLQDAIEAWRDDFWAALRPITGSACELVDIVGRDGALDVTVPVGEAGTTTGGVLPSSCAHLVTKRVAMGRNGRFFWPGAPENRYDEGGRITTTGATAVQAALDAALTAIDAGGVNFAVFREVGSVLEPVTALEIRPVIGTQRRRLF